MTIARGSGGAGVGSAITPTDGTFLVGDGSRFAGELGATARASMGLASIEAAVNIAPADGAFLVGNGSVWVVENGDTVRASLGLNAGGGGDIWVEKVGDTMTGDLTGPGFYGDATFGPAIIGNENASTTNPTVCPYKADETSGVSGATGAVYLIANGVQVFSVSAGAASFQKDLVAQDGSGPMLKNAVPSKTNPTVIVNKTEIDTGWGWVTDEIWGILGGVSQLRIASDDADEFELFNYANDATFGPSLALTRARGGSAGGGGAAGVANDYLGTFYLKGYNNAGTPVKKNYGFVACQILDPSSGSEDGTLLLGGAVAGVETTLLSLNNTGAFIPTGYSYKVGTTKVATNDAWVSFDPNFVPYSGSWTSTTGESGYYLKIGKLVFFKAQIEVTDVGTGASAIQFTLPVTGRSGIVFSTLCGRKDLATMQVYQLGVSTGTALLYNGGDPNGNAVFNVSGVYEAA